MDQVVRQPRPHLEDLPVQVTLCDPVVLVFG